MTLLNSLERITINNPLRALVQRRVETQWFIEQGGVLPGATVLELGCGRGVGVQILFDTFGVRRVDAFDLDPKMITLAQQKLAPYQERLRLFVGDATKIDAPDASYDAVFDFAIIHHIPNWRDAITEVSRVLKPNGKFYASEVLKRFITHPLWKRAFHHPQQDRFDQDTFAQSLEENGLKVLAMRHLYQQVGIFVAEKK
jgi:ubiquinone/menaquinone biosynthesis C-methylase UbiE